MSECVCVKGRGSILYINVLECVRVCVCVSGSVCVSWNGVEELGRGTALRVEGRGLGLRVEVESRGTGLRVGVEGRGRESRDGECMSELESEYERVRARELI